MSNLYIDIETYCDLDLRSCGVYAYAEHPSFRVLMAAWAIDDGPVTVAVTPDDLRGIPGLWKSEVEKVAHNAQFERVCLTRTAGLGAGVFLPPHDWYDTAAAAAEHGHPRGLASLAASLGCESKDEAGKDLIRLFCMPDRKTGRRNLPEDHPERWAEFMEYCRQDVVVLRDVHTRLDPMSCVERAVWLADQEINDRGVKVDTTLARAAVEQAADNALSSEVRIAHLTGIANPNSGPQMLKWLRESGLTTPNMQAATVQGLLDGELTDVQRAVLTLRQSLALVAAKKYSAAMSHVSGDDRLRGSFRYHGAHTGRWTGSGVQLHNLPRAALDSPLDAEMAICDLKMGEGADAHTLKALVRSMFLGPMCVVDYASIEARVLAWLAGERWALDAFGGGRDIYVETAQRMGGLTRFQGKVAVLALGYGGGTGSLAAMGAQGTMQELQFLVDQWRAANPAIVELWSSMERSFKSGGPVGDHVTVETDGSVRRIRLPSGRAMVYRDCKWKWAENQWGNRSLQASFTDPKGFRTGTYGGRLIENVTQAVARDIMANALVSLTEWGFPVVGHVHDEILVEGPVWDLQGIKGIMIKNPEWAPGLPLDGEGFACDRYRKG